MLICLNTGWKETMKTTIDWWLLGANVASIVEGDENAPLVAGPAGGLHTTTSLLGRSYSAIYQSLAWLAGGKDQFIQKKRIQALARTQMLFCEALKVIASESSTYRHAIAGTPTSVEAALSRSNITSFTEALDCLIDQEDLVDRVQKIDTLFIQTVGGFNTGHACTVLRSLEVDFALASVEAVLQAPYPFTAFKKIICREQITAYEKEEIETWIAKAVSKKERLSSRTLHRAFYGIVTSCTSGHQALCRFEWILFQAGLRFLKEDFCHQKWCESLHEGMSLDTGRDIVIGKEAYHSFFLSLGIRLFDCRGNRMIMVSGNPCTLSIWYASCIEMTSTTGSWAIPCVRVLEPIDVSGRYLVIESVACSLADERWKEEKGATKELIRFLQWLGQQQLVPHTLSAETIFCTSDGHLRVFTPMELSEAMTFSLSKVEEFVWQCAHGDILLFKELMYSSALISHPLAAWYQKMARLFLEQKSVLSIEEHALQYKINRQETERTENLISSLQQCVRQIMTATFLKKISREKIVASVLALQQEYGFCSSVTPNLVQKVCSRLT